MGTTAAATATRSLPGDLAGWLVHWQAVHPQGIAMGLERVAEVAARLGVGKPAPLVITVGGTNGKGSTVAFLDAILRASDRVVGSFTSPHLLDYNERVRVDGEAVDDVELVSAFRRIEQARGDVPLTYFEAGTLAALLIFQAREVDVVLLEVGMGGRLDAVNLVDADAAIVTTVDLDHQEWLGGTRELIGHEKAGIFRAGCSAIFGAADAPASLLAHGRAIGAGLQLAGVDFRVEDAVDGWRLRHADGSEWLLPTPALHAPVQVHNAAAAIAALHALRERLPLLPERIAFGVANARLAGRLQTVAQAPEVVVDVAHNAQAARELARWLALQPVRRTVAVFSALADKDHAGIAAPLAPAVDAWWTAGLDGESPRGLDAATVGARLAAAGIDARALPDVHSALAAARVDAGPDGRVLVFGSFFTVAAALRAVGVRHA